MSDPHTHAANIKVGHGPPSVDSWGTLGNLTQSQQQALAEFQRQLPPSKLDTAKFTIETYENVSLRFLRARNFQVPNAIQLLNECVKRKVDGKAATYASVKHPDQCTQCDTEALKKYYPHTQFGYDRFNRPILFEHSGAVDGDAIRQMTTVENLINYHWYSMDTILNQMFEIASKQGPSIISTCVILDLSGLSTHHCSSKVLDHVKALVALDNTCYPEILGKMFVVNAPWLAVTMWEMAKGWLDIRTQQKIEILGTGPETHQRLLQFITPENLPRSYGGTAPDPFLPRPHTEYVHIPRSGLIKKMIHVSPHQKLVIESYITDGDIGLEVYYRRRPGHSHHSHATSHHQAHQSTQHSHPGHTHHSTSHSPSPHEAMSQSDWNRFLSSHDKEWKIFLKKELKNTNPTSDKQGNTIPRAPLRSIIEVHHPKAHNTHEESSVAHDYIVLWTNSAMFYTRPLAFNLLIKDLDPPVISPAADSSSSTSMARPLGMGVSHGGLMMSPVNTMFSTMLSPLKALNQTSSEPVNRSEASDHTDSDSNLKPSSSTPPTDSEEVVLEEL